MPNFLYTFPKNSWSDFFESEQKKKYWTTLDQFLQIEYDTKTCYPPATDIFKAFEVCEPQMCAVLSLAKTHIMGMGKPTV
jgi:uracil-DNA glycosylase